MVRICFVIVSRKVVINFSFRLSRSVGGRVFDGVWIGNDCVLLYCVNIEVG